jgi:holliday junction DNA helicase RuvA
MISAITGTLSRIEDDRVHLAVGPILCELMVPAADMPFLSAGLEQTVTFYTLMYFEGDGGGGSMEPRLLGFLRPEDKRFFEKFITVKGIGPKKALKAFIFPASDIAAAIENKDARFLVQLPAIGKRMAEQIVAELSGKVQEFVIAGVERRAGAPARGVKHTPLEEDAIQALMALGERRETAESLLERAKAANDKLTTPEALIREMFRLRAVRA